MPTPHQARWFRRSPQHARRRVWRETLTTRHGAFQAMLRLCEDGGCVVTFPALPPLMVHGATFAHARVKALALVERYLRSLESARPAVRGAGRRQPVLPLAA